MKVQCLLCLCLGILLFKTTHALAHSADELKAVFDQTPIPEELLEVTKELGGTAGMKSIREAAHAKQHEILEQHVRALADRKCRQSVTNISVIDGEIVDFRDKGTTEVEQKLREIRDDTAAFVETECTDTLVKPFHIPEP